MVPGLAAGPLGQPVGGGALSVRIQSPNKRVLSESHPHRWGSGAGGAQGTAGGNSLLSRIKLSSRDTRVEDFRTHKGQRSSINEDLEEIKTEAMENSPRGAANGHRRDDKERQQIFGSFNKGPNSFRAHEANRRGGGAGS